MNILKRLMRLVDGPALQVADVIAVSGGTATLELPGGGRVQARGDVTVGDKVFFRGDAIEGPAPNLPVELIGL